MKLTEVTGPKCPRCECQHSTVIERGERFGSSLDRRQCRHCGRVFRVKGETAPLTQQEAPVVYHLIKCPKCRSGKTHITSTRRPVRHHKCDGCQATFKSYEESR